MELEAKLDLACEAIMRLETKLEMLERKLRDVENDATDTRNAMTLPVSDKIVDRL